MSTGIQWTDETWNPVVGCEAVSPGCDHCYAKKIHDMRHRAHQAGKSVAPQYAVPFETVQLKTERMTDPLGWQKPVRIFVNSVSDLFHDAVPFEYIAALYGVMSLAHRHQFQILTKRPGRARAFHRWILEQIPAGHGHYAARRLAMNWIFDRLTTAEARRTQANRWERAYDIERPWPPENVWLGVSVEGQAQHGRIATLRDTPAAVRFVSFEPLLEAVEPDLTGIDWAIIGGESGEAARPFDLDWAHSLVRACRDAGTAPFVKQLGAHPCVGLVTGPVGTGAAHDDFIARTGQEYDPEPQWLNLRDSHGGDMEEWPEDLRVREFPTLAPRSPESRLASPARVGGAET